MGILSVSFVGMVCALKVVKVFKFLADSGPNSPELHVSPTLWIKSEKKWGLLIGFD